MKILFFWLCIAFIFFSAWQTDTVVEPGIRTIKGWYPHDTLHYNCDSLKRQNDSLKTKLFVANYKVERVRYYLKIAIKNPSQTKFLKSWISRAIQ